MIFIECLPTGVRIPPSTTDFVAFLKRPLPFPGLKNTPEMALLLIFQAINAFKQNDGMPLAKRATSRSTPKNEVLHDCHQSIDLKIFFKFSTRSDGRMSRDQGPMSPSRNPDQPKGESELCWNGDLY
ncbi:MAG: hypothetical protein H7839_03755 [Magnetococcus sp. YQC-5]